VFQFLKYIQPTWYYRLASRLPAPLLADFRLLNDSDSALITPDFSYTSYEAIRMDAAYQGLQRGVLPGKANSISQDNICEINTIQDNYRFVRKYFATHWYIYTLFIRLLTLHNPFREVGSFIRMYRTKRINLYLNVPVFSDFRTELNESPLVSVIIPTLNRYAYLKDVLADLEKQDYKNFEVLVCDQSDPFKMDFYSSWRLNLTLIRQEEKALWLARNTCISKAKGEYILLFDDDSRVQPDWIREHLICLESLNVSISAGVTHTIVGHGSSQKERYYHLSDVFDTGNSMVKRRVFEKNGLFDCQFEKQRMGDGEFGLRSLLSGFQVVSNPYAKRIHLKVETGGLRQMGSWDAIRPKNIFSPRPIPSVLYFFRKYFGKEATIYFLIQNITFSYMPYKWKKNKSYKAFMLLFLLPMLPFLIVSVLKSWRLSTVKLSEGAKIDFLN
jgi:glycosyltransferase involved in cell wall biosynthesis